MSTTHLIPSPKRYGVTEKKKSELDALTIQVTDTQYDVQQMQAIVDSLTTKAANFQAYVVTNDNNRARTLSNRNMLTQILQSATSLQQNSETAFNAIVIADSKTRDVAVGVKVLIDKLIYSAEVINKLSNLIIRKKALNPLINDDLVAKVSTAGADANNAVALTLVALQSAYAAQASNLQSEAASALQYTQAIKLYDVLSGQDEDEKDAENSLSTLLDNAYENAKKIYDQSVKASDATNQQLSVATANLVQAQIKLRSYQLGLAAANAAALAS
ncbi:hypothetical protein EWM62_06865 [Mucilaginibacter terrigena]|uniref:Uncharacterized protein n=1 Tax=Mucilaginibacter terrigena TaxID=2492395 RepID=A0A4Q5LQF1_9SPHI|nr:hypothetical protein [Mucilaginibacter terrigena]RYU91654.1 hypothetical protein EWM62_06865 [Mucilaginibacter terrigena]